MEIPAAWQPMLQNYLRSEIWERLRQAAQAVYRDETVYPPENLVFRALTLTPPKEVRVVILGQDPYHEPRQAMGLSFSVPAGSVLPPSLRNIYRELADDLGVVRSTGDLTDWAEQGVLLLNTVLTVRAGTALSHESLGWQSLTDALIAGLTELRQPVAFFLWGRHAQKKLPLTASIYPRLTVCSAHPSPLSAHRGFFGSRPFSQANSFFTLYGQKPIDWS